MDKLSVWLLPPKKIQAVYEPLTTPKFEPHITIIGAVALKGEVKSILQVLGSAVKNIRPIPIELTEVSASTTYFQCVFARVKPNLELFRTYQLIKSVLRYSDPAMFVPHMSLVYGNIGLEERFALTQKIKLPITNFTADRICVVNADSINPKTWKHIADYKMIT